MKNFALIIIGLLSMSTISHATSMQDVKKNWDKCLEENGDSTMAQKMCAGEAGEEADAELNKLYQRIMKSEDEPEAKKRLLTSQRIWIKFRDANCDLSAISFLGGSGESVIYAGCVASTTINRVTELEELFFPK